MPHTTTWTERDYSGETSNVTIFNGAVTALSIGGYLTAIGAGRTALAGITRGVMAKEQWTGDITTISNARPTDPDAQRELKWLVAYEGDTSHKLYQISLPVADPNDGEDDTVPRVTPGTDLANLANESVAAWVTWFEGFARTPDNDTETVTVREIRLVGRNV